MQEKERCVGGETATAFTLPRASKALGRYRKGRPERIGDMRTEMNVIGGVGVAAIIGCCMVYSQGWCATQAVTEAPQVPVDDAVNQAALYLLANPPCGALVTDPCPTMLEMLDRF